MADFEYDLSEMVTWDREVMTLEAAVQKIMQSPKWRQSHLLVFRGRGKQPETFAGNDIAIIVSEIS
jgi:hypothetical protein